MLTSTTGTVQSRLSISLKRQWPGIFNNTIELHDLNYIAIGRQEFFAYMTHTWTPAIEVDAVVGRAEESPLSVIAVNFKKTSDAAAITFKNDLGAC
jgi:hypothetical protein